jgi:hypothetical protein
VSAAGAQPAEPQAAEVQAAGAAPQAPMAAAPPRRRTSPLVWVLIAILGLFILGGIATIGTGLFVLHKVRQAGVDTDLLKNNPGYAVAKMMLAANPDMEEVSHDERAGTITLRNRKSGKYTTMNFADIKNGRFKITADSDDGGTAGIEVGSGASKLPAWVPAYPGAKDENTVSIHGAGEDGKEGGNLSFTTPDPPSRVISFYQDKARALGMKVNFTSTGDEGGMIVATDEDLGRSLTVIVGSGTHVNVTYGTKK